MAADRVISVEEFAAETPAVPAERITCGACGSEYIGDPEHEPTCPDCLIEQGRYPRWEHDDEGGQD